MANSHAKGAHVTWHWGTGTGEGVVKDRFERRVQRTIEGKRIVRNGTEKNPAYLVESDEGARVLKLGSELTKR